MSWPNELVLIVRHLINDLDTSNESYDDTRIEECITVASQLLINSIDFTNSYTIDCDRMEISPDPTTTGSKDNDFINLVCLKSAIIILGGECKKLAGQSYSIRDGAASIDVSNAYKNTKDLLDHMTEEFACAVQQYKAGSSVSGKVVTTPFTSSYVDSRGSIF